MKSHSVEMIRQVAEGCQGGGFSFQGEQQRYCLFQSKKLLVPLQNFLNLQAGLQDVEDCCFFKWIHDSLGKAVLMLTSCAEWARYCSQRLCLVLHLPLGPETHQNLAEVGCHRIDFVWRAGGSPVDRELALCTFRRLLLLWILTHPLGKLLSISFRAFCPCCLFILFQIGIISQHMFSWHTVSSTWSAIKVSVVTGAPEACSVCLPLGIEDALPPLKIFSPFSLFFKDCWGSGEWSGDGESLLLKIFFPFSFLAL